MMLFADEKQSRGTLSQPNMGPYRYLLSPAGEEMKLHTTELLMLRWAEERRD